VSGADLADCQLRAEAAGYNSEPIDLTRNQLNGVVHIGTIFLHPMAPAGAGEGFSIGAVSLAAPDKAKKEFQKGQEQAKKGKWAAACDYFRKAVQVYPRYALAWLELGRAQMQQNNFLDAQQSFQQATTQDSDLLPAYMELARFALERKEWKLLAESTDHILQLLPQSPPLLWLLNGAASFNVGDIPHAEISVTRGLRLDAQHKVPQLEYLYAVVLEREGKVEAAVEHIKTYLQLAPKADDAQQAQQRLAAIEKQLSDLRSSASR
jgi:tetratricopeptide (TPR) repeat protein